MLAVSGVLETVLYCADNTASAAFYRDVLGLTLMRGTPRVIALSAGPASVLLLFTQGAGRDDVVSEHGSLPGHDARGRQHLAFAVAAADLDAWRTKLRDAGIPLTGEYRWPAGGISLYFSDPDSHVVEIATPGVWDNY